MRVDGEAGEAVVRFLDLPRADTDVLERAVLSELSAQDGDVPA